MARAKTEEEVRQEFLGRLRTIAEYWANSPGKTEEERCKGVVFSILSLLDGCTFGFPSVDLCLQPHPDDKHFCQQLGENWYDPGMVFNDRALHELWYTEKE